MQCPADAYRAFRTTLRRYVARRLRRPEDVEDVLQEVFLRVTRNRAALAEAREPAAWLRTVAKSAILDHLRRAKKHDHIDADAAPEELPADPSSGADDAFGACLALLVNALHSPYGEAVRYVDLAGGRQTDLAAETGMSVSTVKSHVQRGRRLLKAAILECCEVERDGRGNVMGLAPGDCGANCC